jgi:hypothetical protein
VGDDYAGADSASAGTIAWVRIGLDSLRGGLDPVPPDDRLRATLSRQ